MKLILKAFIVVLGVLLMTNAITCSENISDNQFFTLVCEGAKNLMFSSHPAAATTRLVIADTAISFKNSRDNDGEHENVMFGLVMDSDQQRRMANIKKAAFIGTHFTMRTVGDMVEDYVHEKGFDATRLITKQYNSVPFVRDNVVKPTVETGIFVGKEITYAYGAYLLATMMCGY